VEDSPVGIASAKGAGLFCVACPNEMTRSLDLSAADMVLETFEGFAVQALMHRRGEELSSAKHSPTPS
jgi:beta-phosphoglucomutase-like phosphatase (HAD superfamily)